MPRLSRGLVVALAMALCCYAPRGFISPAPRTTPLEAPAVRRVAQSLSDAMPSSFSCGVLLLTAALAGAGRKTVRRAEPPDLPGILGSFGEMKKEDEEEEEVRKEGEVDTSARRQDELNAINNFMDKEFDITDLEEYAKKIAEEEASDTSQRQIFYELYPSKQYVLYLAKKNAIRSWQSDGPEGKDRGCIEVQIAVATEKIRNMILHLREYRRDYKTRLKLVMLVNRRRRMMDKLAASNLDSYMKIREELKIRHVYRLEALQNRLSSYLYPIKDRPRRPGRKTKNRLKKVKQLMARRLATQLRQGREHRVIHRTKKKMNFRSWMTLAYDECKALVKGKEIGTYVDPLNLP